MEDVPMPDKRDRTANPDDVPASPYGPQRRTDEAAGGADSSPLENIPSGEKADAAKDPSRQGDGE